MSRRVRPLRVLALALLVAGAAAFVSAPPAVAAELRAAGWWSRLATTDPLSESPQALPIPNPTTPDTVPNPSVAEGQLLVEGTPEGATAMAALHWQLADRESSPSLTLPIGPGSTVNPQSVILACRAAVEWTPPETRPGRWEIKPVTDGRACINGIVADDLSTVAFGLQPLVNGDSLDIVLVPGRLPDAPPEIAGVVDGSAFRWVFDDPSPEALAVVDSDFEFGEGPVDVTLPPTSTLPLTTASAASPGPSSRPSASSSATAPASAPIHSRPTGDTSAVAAPALDAADLGRTVPRAVDGALASASTSTASRTVGLVLLALALGVAAWTQLSAPGPETAMIGLGRFRQPVPGSVPDPSVDESAPTGGLGRFARPRSEPPVPIA